MFLKTVMISKNGILFSLKFCRFKIDDESRNKRSYQNKVLTKEIFVLEIFVLNQMFEREPPKKKIKKLIGGPIWIVFVFFLSKFCFVLCLVSEELVWREGRTLFLLPSKCCHSSWSNTLTSSFSVRIEQFAVLFSICNNLFD